ncbi:MAG: ZIP family metal transporter, partial [Longimicrobiales bacterium]
MMDRWSEPPVTALRASAGETELRESAAEVPARSPSSSDRRTLRRWALGLGPLLLVGLLVFVFLQTGPAGVFERAFPPVEELTLQRVTLPAPGSITLRVVNGGPEPVTIAQVLVDNAAWRHTIDGPRTIPRLGRRTIEIPYPWVEGDPLEITVLTSTGLTFTTQVPVATESPAPDVRYFTTFALLGLYVGVVPVLLGLLWLPFLRELDPRWLDFFLSLTAGLLVFLGTDAFTEAIASARQVPAAFQGVGLVVLGILVASLGLSAVGGAKDPDRSRGALRLALLIAIGIGLHNLAEGLAIGTSYAAGEIALGTYLVLGFLLHNTTEGLAIVAPVAGERTKIGRIAVLGLIAGVPTIAGAWLGGFSSSPARTTLFLALGAGAIAQVVYMILRMQHQQGRLTAPLNAAGFIAGIVLMYATGLFVA